MKKSLLAFACATLLAGCISSAKRTGVNWTVSMDRTFALDAEEYGGVAIKGVVKLLHLAVRAPYDTRQLVVLRADGSIAFDAFNTFAAAPAQLLKGIALDSLERSQRFSRVVPANSSARTDYTVEVEVETLALDCRKDSRRDAVVALTLTLLKSRDVVASSHGEAKIPANGADYSAAFSRAFGDAFARALAGIAGDE